MSTERCLCVDNGCTKVSVNDANDSCHSWKARVVPQLHTVVGKDIFAMWNFFMMFSAEEGTKESSRLHGRLALV